MNLSPSSERSTAHVVVIGSGIAGAAASIAAATVTPSVVMLDGGSGASTLATGAIDRVFWKDSQEEPAKALSEGAQAIVAALEGYVVPVLGCAVVTMAGMVRRADGHDAALLDVSALGAGRVGVVDCHRPGWNARELARAWGEGYAPFESSLLRHTDESLLPDADLAARHDDAGRLGWLAERLREALARARTRWTGIVLPPMLGVERPRAQALSQSVGLPCGEAVGSPGGPAGLRFESARDRALSSARAVKVMARASAVERYGETWRVTTEDGLVLQAYSVVFATGGLIGGGIAYAPSEALLATALPPHVKPPLQLTLSAPVRLGARGRLLEAPGSLCGFAPEALARPFARDSLVEAAGILAEGLESGQSRDGRPRGLFAAGDVVADAARAWLGALSQGAQAGADAAQSALSRATVASGAKPAIGPAIRL